MSLSGTQIFLDAVLYPHRSLSLKGFGIVSAIMIAIAAGGGAYFASLGAWPVIGFSGVEYGLFLGLLYWHMRRRPGHERILLSIDELRIEFHRPGKPVRIVQLSPAWIGVELTPADDDPRLMIRSHGRRIEIGRCLSSAERADFAASLSDALRRWRQRPRLPYVLSNQQP